MQIYSDKKDLELPVASVEFYKVNGKLNLLVGSTLGYLVTYMNINPSNKLQNNLVINNSHLEEAIVDVKLVDLTDNGIIEIAVLYFNKVIHIYRIIDYNKYNFVGRYELKEVINFPFKFSFLKRNNQEYKILLFANNHVYEYDLNVLEQHDVLSDSKDSLDSNIFCQ